MKTVARIGIIGLLVASTQSYADGHEKAYALTGCGVTEVTIIDEAGGVTIGHNKSRGTTRTDEPGGLFDAMAYECQSVWTASKAGLVFSGRCTFVDIDGDRVVGMASKPDPASKDWDWTYLGGSGKWGGLEGGGKGSRPHKMPKLRAGVNASCWEAKGLYTLKK